MVWTLLLAAIFSWLRDKHYERTYLVFKGTPIHTLVDKYGLQHHLYIQRDNSRFLIGMKYSLEVDDHIYQHHTRWKEVFPDYDSAETELLRRYTEWKHKGTCEP